MLVGYMRVSSTDDRQSTDLQRDALLAAGVDERHLFEDRASGARDDRPGLKQCLDYLKAGDVLVVWKLDRLGRSLAHLIQIVTGLRERDVELKSVTEAIDTTTAMGEFQFHVFGALAQYERSLIRERVNAGLEAAKRRGRRGGRPRKLDDEKIEAARALLANGMTLSAAARSVGVPRSTLVDSLNRIMPAESSPPINQDIRHAAKIP
jgi:DNA invertase Pin-like site-specific DNA recombinase